MLKRFRWVLAVLLGLTAVCLVLGLFVAYNANQPIVSCVSAPRKPLTFAPTALVTAQDYMAQGDADYEQSNCEQAILDYTHAIELNPNLAEAYNNRAYVYMVQRDYSAALTDLNRALQLRPTYVNALMNRGDIYNYYYAINYERAVADYDQVLTLDPSAMNHTSVCGHRLLALHHGWNLNVITDLLAQGVTAGCPMTHP